MDLIKNNNFLNSIDKIVYWAKLFAVLYLVSGGLMILVGLVIAFTGAYDQVPGLNGVGLWVCFFYIFIGVIYMYPGIKLLNFSNHTRQALNENDETKFVDGFVNFAEYYTFFGVITVIAIAFYALLIGVGIISGLAAAL